MCAFFSVPAWQDPAGGPAKPVFQVFPESADIKAGGCASFRLAFRPPKDAQHFSQLLHLRAYVKSMRNFRLVPDALVVPPWSVPLLASGNTFLHTNPEFAPKVRIQPNSLWHLIQLSSLCLCPSLPMTPRGCSCSLPWILLAVFLAPAKSSLPAFAETPAHV